MSASQRGKSAGVAGVIVLPPGLENGYRDRVGSGGKHHEIYMGDPRRAKPEKLKTILRHPIEKAK